MNKVEDRTTELECSGIWQFGSNREPNCQIFFTFLRKSIFQGGTAFELLNHARLGWHLAFQSLAAKTCRIIRVFSPVHHKFSRSLLIVNFFLPRGPWTSIIMMSINTTSVGVCYNLPDLKCPEDDILALEILQIVDEVKAHLPMAKQETVSKFRFDDSFVMSYLFER